MQEAGFVTLGVRRFFQHLGRQTPVVDALHHIFADPELDDGVVRRKDGGIPRRGLHALFQPAVAEGKGLVP